MSEIAKCSLCGGDVRVQSTLTKKGGVDYSKYELPPLSELVKMYYCTCDKHCFVVFVPTMVVGEIYDTEEKAIDNWNDFVAQWNEKAKSGKQ